MEDSAEQLKLYRLLVENSLGLMCIHDLEGVLRFLNPAAFQSLGYYPEDGYHPEYGVGRNLRDFLAPSVRHLFDEELARFFHNFPGVPLRFIPGCHPGAPSALNKSKCFRPRLILNRGEMAPRQGRGHGPFP